MLPLPSFLNRLTFQNGPGVKETNRTSQNVSPMNIVDNLLSVSSPHRVPFFFLIMTYLYAAIVLRGFVRYCLA